MRQAGYACRHEKAAGNMAVENLGKPAIRAYITELERRFQQSNEQRVATIEERRNLLTQWIYSDDVRYNDKLKALDILNKMDAAYEQRIKMDTTINNPVQSLTTEELRKLIDNKPD
nr:MAG TPA: Terminase small subunit [Caudoviricetes sp.]